MKGNERELVLDSFFFCHEILLIFYFSQSDVIDFDATRCNVTILRKHKLNEMKYKTRVNFFNYGPENGKVNTIFLALKRPVPVLFQN